jgi:hypothetical protein
VTPQQQAAAVAAGLFRMKLTTNRTRPLRCLFPRRPLFVTSPHCLLHDQPTPEILVEPCLSAWNPSIPPDRLLFAQIHRT